MTQDSDPRTIFCSFSAFSHLCLRLAVLLVTVGLGNSYECGGFIGMSASSTGTIQSPDYPGNYPNYTRCIWIFEAPNQYVSRLTVDFVGETFNSACSDYVEFRDGGPNGDVIQTSCATLSSAVVTSTGRWMYVLFASDGISQATGLSAIYSTVNVGASINDSISDPISKCRSYEFECGNRLCISRAYRCDGYYDCGCGNDCDEDGCAGLQIEKRERMAIGFSVGIVIFVVAATLGRSLEKHHNWEKERGQTDPTPTRRQGWSSARNDRGKVGSIPMQSTPVPSPRVTASCNIKISEIA